MTAETRVRPGADVVSAYDGGARTFKDVRIADADFRGRDLSGAEFFHASLRRADFSGAYLEEVRFLDCDLRGASFAQANLFRGEFEWTSLDGARLVGAAATRTSFFKADLGGADLTRCDLGGAHFFGTDLGRATVTGSMLGNTTFTDVDVGCFCDRVSVFHAGPSFVDFRSVLRSYRHPGLKRFLVDCGVPEAVAEFTIDAARAEGEGALESLMRSTFISYGGPDEPFARRLYDALRAKHVTTFFFPETARIGRRIGDEVHGRIQEHDRVILVCSRDSLDRPGVRNEVQETFDREARDGGATYLLPIMLDDYVLTGWADPLAQRVRDRVVGDFRGAMGDDAAFEKALGRLLDVLRKHHA